MIHRLLDRLAERYSEREHKLEAMRAREEYFDRAGKVFDDDAELFEGRMAAFLEWYVLERPLADIGLTPVAYTIEEKDGLPADERRALAALATSHHSVFELFETAGETLDIEDLIGGGRFAVRERRKPLGMAAGDLFEARLLWDGDTIIFGRTFLFHPPDAREVVLEWVERAVNSGTAREEILFHLSRQHIRWHRQGHVGAAKVYRDA
ncbi:MAG TPA: hypothetical protein VKQ32_20390 [Polyangia bacterium]|nr:hypothetical protein [Polyangia bacterium]